MKPSLYEHFHPDEKPFVDKALGWTEDAARHRKVKRTDFLDPRQSAIVGMLANRQDGIRLRTDGGYPEAERQRAILVPDFLDPDDEPIGIDVLAVTSDDPKIADLDHGDYLGAMLGAGVKREKIGDIHVHDWGAHILVAEEMAPFFALHLTQAGKVRVSADTIPVSMMQTADQKLDELFCTVASLRLDGVVSEVTRQSRAKVLPPIQAGRCKLNWKVAQDPSRTVKEGDVVSLQGYGRFKILAVEGVSKKGRIRLKIGKFM